MNPRGVLPAAAHDDEIFAQQLPGNDQGMPGEEVGRQDECRRDDRLAPRWIASQNALRDEAPAADYFACGGGWQL